METLIPVSCCWGWGGGVVFPSYPVLWEDRDGPSLPFLSPYWENGFETVVDAGLSTVMAPDVQLVTNKIVPIGKSIVT